MVRFQDGIAHARPIAQGYVRRHQDFYRHMLYGIEMGTSSSEKDRGEMKERTSGNSGGVDNGLIVTKRYTRTRG